MAMRDYLRVPQSGAMMAKKAATDSRARHMGGRKIAGFGLAGLAI